MRTQSPQEVLVRFGIRKSDEPGSSSGTRNRISAVRGNLRKIFELAVSTLFVPTNGGGRPLAREAGDSDLISWRSSQMSTRFRMELKLSRNLKKVEEPMSQTPELLKRQSDVFFPPALRGLFENDGCTLYDEFIPSEW